MKTLRICAVAVVVAACGGLSTRSTSLPNGERAPAFELEDSAGERVALADLLEEGPVVVIFYRGHW